MADSPSSPPSPGPSSSASGDQPDGQSRNKGERKPDEPDMPQDTKGSRPILHLIKDCPPCQMSRLVFNGQYWEAVAYTRTNDVSRKAELQRYLQERMISCIDYKKMVCKKRRLDYADVMMYLLSERLEDYNLLDAWMFRVFVCEYLKPEYTETLLKLVNKHSTSLKAKRRMWRALFRHVEQMIVALLPLMCDLRQVGMLDSVPKQQERFIHLIELLPATLHADSDPALQLQPWLPDNCTTRTTVMYAPMFAKAVELRLVQEGKLLYEAGAVNNAELMAVANKPDVQKMLKDEEDQSKMAVFLRKVLKQPRHLESMALLQVSRLMGQDVLGREDRVRQLPLPSTLRDDILLRPQVNRYRKETMQ